MSRWPKELGPKGGPKRLRCNDGIAGAEHYAELKSQPPRCVRHYKLWTNHLGANRLRRLREMPELPYDPGPPTLREWGSWLLTSDELGYLIDVVHVSIVETRTRLAAAEGPQQIGEAAEALSDAASLLDDFLLKNGALELWRRERPDPAWKRALAHRPDR